jgi:hypothetical protein
MPTATRRQHVQRGSDEATTSVAVALQPVELPQLELFLGGRVREHDGNVARLKLDARKNFERSGSRFSVLKGGDLTYVVDGGERTYDDVKDEERKADPRVIVLDRHGLFYGRGIPIGVTNLPESEDPPVGRIDLGDMEKLNGLKPLPGLGSRLAVLIYRDRIGGLKTESLLPDSLHIHISPRIDEETSLQHGRLGGQKLMEFTNRIRDAERTLAQVVEGGWEDMEAVIVSDTVKRGGKDVRTERKQTPNERVQFALEKFGKLAEDVGRAKSR